MNIHDHYNDLMHLLDLSGYPCKHLDGRAEGEDAADCCDYLTGILIAHMEQLDDATPITIEKTKARSGEFGACWEISNGNWIECELEGKRDTLAGEYHTYTVDGYSLKFNDGNADDRFFSVKEYGTPRRAFEAAKAHATR